MQHLSDQPFRPGCTENSELQAASVTSLPHASHMNVIEHFATSPARTVVRKLSDFKRDPATCLSVKIEPVSSFKHLQIPFVAD